MRCCVSMSHSQHAKVPFNTPFTKLLSPHYSFLSHTAYNYPVSNDIVFFPVQRVLSFSFLMKLASWAEAQALMHGQTLCSYLLFITLSCLLIKVEEVSLSLCLSFALSLSISDASSLLLHLFFSSSQFLTFSWLDTHMHRDGELWW